MIRRWMLSLFIVQSINRSLEEVVNLTDLCTWQEVFKHLEDLHTLPPIVVKRNLDHRGL
jgi:hypothetical protein